MSREDFLKFREAVIGNDALKEELAKKVKSKEDLQSMANRLGYRFTVEDVSSAIELSDNELQSVSGGVGGIRTRDPLNPIQVRYQAAPRPDRRRHRAAGPPGGESLYHPLPGGSTNPGPSQ